jgi:hypothetical protein
VFSYFMNTQALFTAIVLPCILSSFRLGANTSGTRNHSLQPYFKHTVSFPCPPLKKRISTSSNTIPGIDVLAHCVAAIGAAARTAVAALSPEDRACMQEAVKSTQTAAAEAAAAPAAAATRTSAQVRRSCSLSMKRRRVVFSHSCRTGCCRNRGKARYQQAVSSIEIVWHQVNAVVQRRFYCAHAGTQLLTFI